MFSLYLTIFSRQKQVQQFKHERECNAIIAKTREDKIIRLENLMDGALSTKDFLEDELASLKIEHEVYMHLLFVLKDNL